MGTYATLQSNSQKLVLLQLKLLQRHEMMKLSVDKKRNTYDFIGSERQNVKSFVAEREK